MDRVAIEVLIILVLILANGMFSMSEMAIVSARRARLQQHADQGSRGARTALDLLDSPNQFLSTAQIGITLIGTLAGAFGGATVAEQLAARLSQIAGLAPYAEAISVACVVVIITYLSLVIGELVPKRLALSSPERIAARVAPWMQALSRLASPVVRLLGASTDAVLRLLGIRLAADVPVSEQEINLMIEQGTQVGVFEPAEQEMVERIFRLGDRPASSLMTPRTDVIWLDLDEPMVDIYSSIVLSGHSHFPVARQDLDDVQGVVLAKDLLAQSLSGRVVDLHAVLRPALFVPETVPALELLERLRTERTQVALVIDEYGGFQGLVTISDLLEAIVGDIAQSEAPPEPEAVQRADGSWLLDGRILAAELKDLLDLDSLPDEESGHYQTLGGLVMAYLGRIPASGDRFEWAGWQFEVMDMDGRRVDKVLLTRADLQSP